MSTLIGRMSDALTDADEVSYSTEQDAIHPAEELIDAVADFLNASTRDKVAEALISVNGLRPTEAALDVIMAVVRATDDVDENYEGRGAPGLRRYAATARQAITTLVDTTPVTPR